MRSAIYVSQSTNVAWAYISLIKLWICHSTLCLHRLNYEYDIAPYCAVEQPHVIRSLFWFEHLSSLQTGYIYFYPTLLTKWFVTPAATLKNKNLMW